MGGRGAGLSKAARIVNPACSKSPGEFDLASVVARTRKGEPRPRELVRFKGGEKWAVPLLGS
jgi:hypothetical protein